MSGIDLVWVTPIVTFAIAGLLLVLCFRQFDAALKLILAHSRDLWNSLGSPLGFFWVPEGASTFSMGSSLSRGSTFQLLLRDDKPDLVSIEGVKTSISRMRMYHCYYKVALLVLVVDVAVCFLISNYIGPQ